MERSDLLKELREILDGTWTPGESSNAISAAIKLIEGMPQRTEASASMMDLYDAEALAKLFHEAYERLAPRFGYKTREASAKPWEEVPENNRGLMTAVADEILAKFRSELALRLREDCFLSVSQRCAKQNVQCCTVCERMDCCDNQSPAKQEIESLRKLMRAMVTHACAFCPESYPKCNQRCEIHEARQVLGRGDKQ